MFGEFVFEGNSEDGNFYLEDVSEFNFLTRTLPIEESGISFSGEIVVDDKTSVLIDKNVKMKSPEETVRTYQKVMEMRELSEDEIKQINKFKLFFKKLFEVFFRKQKFRVYFTAFWLLTLTLEIATDDYLMALFYVAAIALYNSPIKFAKEMKKFFGSKKKKEVLREELNELNVMGLVYSIPEDDGIKLYFKPKEPSM